MAIVNSFILILGNLTADPTRGVTNNGINVVTFSVAVNNYKKDSKDTNYYYCSAYGEIGETCMRRLHKGNPVFIIGEQEAKLGTARNGNAKMYLNVRVLAMRGLSPHKANAEQQSETDPDTWGEDISSADVPFSF